jgi:hypothetical protein
VKAEKGHFPYKRKGFETKEIRGVYVKIRVDVESTKYDKIDFIQLAIHSTTLLKDGSLIPNDPGTDKGSADSRPLAGYDPITGIQVKGAKSIGWQIDRRSKGGNTKSLFWQGERIKTRLHCGDALD